MCAQKIPYLSSLEKNHLFLEAEKSERRRHPKILHNQGDYKNKVINFLLGDSYMQPHLHPGDEKIEKMFLLEGSFGLIFFDNNGHPSEYFCLEKGKRESINVPAFTWHTYVMLSERTAIYETMNGVYEPSTWKEMAAWAPSENTPEAVEYLSFLKSRFLSKNNASN